MESEVQFVRRVKNELLLQKRSAKEEETVARQYLELREQYVYIFLRLSLIYIKILWERIICIVLYFIMIMIKCFSCIIDKGENKLSTISIAIHQKDM